MASLSSAKHTLASLSLRVPHCSTDILTISESQICGSLSPKTIPPLKGDINEYGNLDRQHPWRIKNITPVWFSFPCSAPSSLYFVQKYKDSFFLGVYRLYRLTSSIRWTSPVHHNLTMREISSWWPWHAVSNCPWDVGLDIEPGVLVLQNILPFSPCSLFTHSYHPTSSCFLHACSHIFLNEILPLFCLWPCQSSLLWGSQRPHYEPSQSLLPQPPPQIFLPSISSLLTHRHQLMPPLDLWIPCTTMHASHVLDTTNSRQGVIGSCRILLMPYRAEMLRLCGRLSQIAVDLSLHGLNCCDGFCVDQQRPQDLGQDGVLRNLGLKPDLVLTSSMFAYWMGAKSFRLQSKYFLWLLNGGSMMDGMVAPDSEKQNLSTTFSLLSTRNLDFVILKLILAQVMSFSRSWRFHLHHLGWKW